MHPVQATLAVPGAITIQTFIRLKWRFIHRQRTPVGFDGIYPYFLDF